MLNFQFLEQEMQFRIAELRRMAEHDKLAILVERGRSRHRRPAPTASLSTTLRFDTVRQAALFFLRRGVPSGGR